MFQVRYVTWDTIIIIIIHYYYENQVRFYEKRSFDNNLLVPQTNCSRTCNDHFPFNSDPGTMLSCNFRFNYKLLITNFAILWCVILSITFYKNVVFLFYFYNRYWKYFVYVYLLTNFNSCNSKFFNLWPEKLDNLYPCSKFSLVLVVMGEVTITEQWSDCDWSLLLCGLYFIDIEIRL